MDKLDGVDSYPLSPLQKGILFHTLHSDIAGMYNVQLVCCIDEKLDVQAFKTAWTKVFERHPVLRTSIQWQAFPEPMQVVHGKVDLKWREEVLAACSEETRVARFEAYLRSDMQNGFSLTEAPLSRCALFMMTDNSYRFVWTSHHLILDARSHYLILDEVLSIYMGKGEEKSFDPALTKPYRLYIDWAARQDLSKSKDFWRCSLDRTSFRN